MASKEHEEILHGPILERYQLEDRVNDFAMDVLKAGFEVRKANGYENVFLIQKKETVEHKGTGTYLCGNFQTCGRKIKYQGSEIPNFTLEIDSSPFDLTLREVAEPYVIIRMK